MRTIRIVSADGNSFTTKLIDDNTFEPVMDCKAIEFETFTFGYWLCGTLIRYKNFSDREWDTSSLRERVWFTIGKVCVCEHHIMH